jgi:hypothetical protein
MLFMLFSCFQVPRDTSLGGSRPVWVGDGANLNGGNGAVMDLVCKVLYVEQDPRAKDSVQPGRKKINWGVNTQEKFLRNCRAEYKVHE